MDQERIKIADVITSEYSDFLSYCAAAGKVFISELSNVDFVAFRASSGKTRDYIRAIRTQLDNPVVLDNKQAKMDMPIPSEESVEPCVLSLLPIKAETEIVETISEDIAEPPNDDINNAALQTEPNDTQLEISVANAEPPSAEGLIEKSGVSEQTDDTENNQQHSVPLSAVFPDESETSLANLFEVNASDFTEARLDLLNLSVRSNNCLKLEKCKTIADVLRKSENDLRGIRNMGTKSVNEVIQKVKDFVSDPSTIEFYSQSTEGVWGFRESKEVSLNSHLKVAIESLLMGDDYSVAELTEDQVSLFKRLSVAVDTLGEEICLEAYLNPEYAIQICNMFRDFSTSHIRYRKAFEEASQRVSRLTDFMKERKALPFIQAYAVKAGDKLSHLVSECSEETTISCIPFLYEKFCQEENTLTLFAETTKFLGWLDFDVNSLISSISENIRKLLSGKSERSLDVFTLRADGKTLEEVGSRYGVTRERIRQIELKVFRTFWDVYSRQKYDLIMLIYALRDGDTVLHLNDLQDTIGDFASVMWACIKRNPEHDSFYYSKTLDAIVVRTDDAADMSESVLLSAVNEMLTFLPELFEIDKKDALLTDLATKNSVPVEMLENVFADIYQITGIFYHKNRLTITFMCEYVLKERFPAGFKIADDFEADRFKQYMSELFGNRGTSITNRALDAKIGGIGVLCDRGKYIHPDFMQVDQHTINTINSYIERSPRSILPYGEIFESLKETFQGTQITNKYLLQGALKKYGCKFSTGRDFVRKTKSVTFVDELETFVEERGVVHKSEILAEFTSLGEAGIGQVVSRSSNVFNIENGYYIHAAQFDIQPEDYGQLRKYLTAACQNIPVNIRSVHEAVAVQFPEFMYRNEFEDRNKLFAALNYMFRGEFNFSRPYIAKLGVNDISNRSVILQHIEDYDSIEIEELIDICEENSIHYVSASYLCQALAPDYIRISKSILMKREFTGITDEVITQAVEIVSDMLESNDYIVGAKITDFLWFPQADVDWNEFLLENLIIQSRKINIIYLIGDPLKHPNAVYVSDKYKNDTFDSLLLKVLTDEVRKGSFTSKVEMREWLKEEGFIEGKLPNFLESAKYFYVNETGVHCADS